MAAIGKNSLKVLMNTENYLRDFGVFFKIHVRKSYKKMDFKIALTDKEFLTM